MKMRQIIGLPDEGKTIAIEDATGNRGLPDEGKTAATITIRKTTMTIRQVIQDADKDKTIFNVIRQWQTKVPSKM